MTPLCSCLNLFAAFSNKEGATRASAAVVSAVVVCWQLFVPSSTFNTFRAQQDEQNRLMWKDHALIRDTLAAHGIYVPTLTDDGKPATAPVAGSEHR